MQEIQSEELKNTDILTLEPNSFFIRMVFFLLFLVFCQFYFENILIIILNLYCIADDIFVLECIAWY